MSLRGADTVPALDGALGVRFRVAGDEGVLWLLPQRAVWWPAERTVFVADVHLGKAAAFRAAGVPVPGGTTGDNLQRLSTTLQVTGAHRLVVLGDWLHARAALTPAVRQALQAWRAAHAALECVLVRGNHDAHAGDPPAELDFRVVEEPWPLGPWVCRHAPPAASVPDHGGVPSAPRRLALCGHVHPVAALRGPARERLRLPCYVLTPSALCLPAFGSFTGGHPVMAEPDVARCVIADDAVWPLERAWPAAWCPLAAEVGPNPTGPVKSAGLP